jgi:hypothetical protein
MAIWKLRPSWTTSRSTVEKLEAIRLAMDAIATVESVRAILEGTQPTSMVDQQRKNKENQEKINAVAF